MRSLYPLKSPSTNPWEAIFRHEGGVSAGVRLAPEVACGRSKTRGEGSNRAETAV
jgi:hypothetical protein